jgi:adenine deaminase
MTERSVVPKFHDHQKRGETMRVRPITEQAYVRLIRTARRQAAASLWIAGGQVLNTYTKEWQNAHVVVSGERIAYVGEKEPMVDEHTDKIDATGNYLVPGYIEPHAHPFQWYNPSALSEYALQTGTTAMISDLLVLCGLLPHGEVEEIMQSLALQPVKQFFWARLDPQIRMPERGYFYTKEGLARMIDHPLVIQGGELTDWRGVIVEDDTILYGLKRVRDRGKRMEGHHPGASVDTLNTAAAAGVTACHESITAEEVLQRLRLGMYATLRHSSIRPDLPELVGGLKRLGIPWSSRLMLTSDGSTPPLMRGGFMDYTIRVAIEAGVPPIDAYVMASLNPAVYYGLDAELGGIAPGRIADILLLEKPENPTPLLVIANGSPAAEHGRLITRQTGIDWTRYSFPNVGEQLDQIDSRWFQLRHPGGAVPVLHMANAVITKLAFEQLPADAEGLVSLDHDPELALIVLIDPVGKRLTQAVVRGFGRNIEALASTYTASASWLAIGRDALAMAKAVERVKQTGGGIVLSESGAVAYEMPLPLAGKMSDRPMAEVIAKAEEFTRLLQQKGHNHLDPIYSLLFFTATHLPFVRLTPEGIYDVKQGQIIQPSSTLL